MNNRKQGVNLDKKSILIHKQVLLILGLLLVGNGVVYYATAEWLESLGHIAVFLGCLLSTYKWLAFFPDTTFGSFLQTLCALLFALGFIVGIEQLKDYRYKHLLKPEGFNDFFLPDPYEYNEVVVYPKNLKKIEQYRNGAYTNTVELKDGEIVFSYRLRSTNGYTYDSSWVAIIAKVLNDKGELAKSYSLESDGCISITDYVCEKRFEVTAYTKSTCISDSAARAFIKDLKTYELLLNSPRLKALEDTMAPHVDNKYFYDRKQQLLRTRLGFDKGDTIAITHFEYDDEGALLKELQEPYKSDVQSRARAMTYEPMRHHKNSQTKKMKTFDWGTWGSEGWHTVHFHDAAGNLSHSLWYDQGKLMGKAQYVTNSDGRILTKTTYAKDTLTVEEVLKYEYNELGLLKKESSLVPEGGVPDITEFKFYF